MDPIESPIDPKEINIKITKLDPPDYKLEFEIPQRLVKRIYKKLKKGGLNYDDKQMTALLVKICVDEGTYRLERESVWGLMPMANTAPPNFSIDAPFSFTSVADTYTFDDMPSLDGIQIKKLQMEISDELIEREIQSQKLECGNRTPLVGTLKVGDEVSGKITVTVDGETEPLFEIDHACIQIQEPGSITVVGDYPYEGINEQLLGVETSDSLSIAVHVPPSFSKTAYRGKSATLELQINSVERITPATIDEVLAQYGIPNETILRTQIKSSLERNFNRENDVVMLNQLYECFDALFDFPLPERMVQNRFNAQCRALEEQPENETELTDTEKNSLLSQARLFIKRQAITAKLRKHLNIIVGEVDIEAQIRSIAERRRQRPEDIKSEFIASNRMHVVINICTEYKILTALNEQITFVDA